MPTLTQAILLGTDRLASAPQPPHAALAPEWQQLDWARAKETTLLEAVALAGTARAAAPLPAGPFPAPELAPIDSSPVASLRATTVLRQLLADEWRALLPEWLEGCARAGARVPPFFLRALFGIMTDQGNRELLLRVIGERGRWLARQNSDWAWVVAAEPAPDPSQWETGTDDERLALLRQVRAAEPARAATLLEQTWADDSPEFRTRALAILAPALAAADEPLLARALTDRRKEIRAMAQALLATLPGSALATRMKARAEGVLALQRGIFGKKLEVNLPAAFDPGWKADALEEKPPAGVGEKAFWAQQILSLVPLTHWREKFGLSAPDLVTLAVKSSDWSDLLLGAWFRAACVHRDAEASAVLVRPLQARPKALPPGTTPQAAAAALLATCDDAQRWQLAAADAELAWSALPLLTGTPSVAQGRALLDHLWPALRDGLNPGGSAAAVLAARRVPPELRDEAAQRLARDHGFSKPAEAFLRALELRAELHAAFSTSPHRHP